MKENKNFILIVDDEMRIRRMLSDFLKSHDYEIVEAKDGREAIDVFYSNDNKIDIILLDVMMPKINGFKVLSEIRQNFLTPVIMLTARGEEYDEITGFKLGADDYIIKPFSPTVLLARIEAVLKRSGKDRKKRLKAGVITIYSLKKEVLCGDRPVKLTLKEYELLLYLIHNQEIVLTREQILNYVWGYDYSGDLRTVDTHIKQLRGKLKRDCQYIETVHGVGYKFEVK